MSAKRHTGTHTPCPPISQELINHLTETYQRKYNVADELFSQKLVFQAGIDTVLDYLRERNKQQEGAIRDVYAKKG